MLTLDTNILVGYLNNNEKIVKQLLSWRKSNVRCFISVITEIEILSLSKLNIEEINKLQKFLREFTIISLDSQLGKLTAEIRRERKFNLGDSIIVATAKLTNSTLITQDKEIIKKAKNLIYVQAIK